MDEKSTKELFEWMKVQEDINRQTAQSLTELGDLLKGMSVTINGLEQKINTRNDN